MTVQISAEVSDVTRDLLDQEVKATGVKKGRLIEDALLFHLKALKVLPAEFIVPPRIVLTPESAQQVLDRLTHPEQPTQALIALMKRHGG